MRAREPVNRIEYFAVTAPTLLAGNGCFRDRPPATGVIAPLLSAAESVTITVGDKFGSEEHLLLDDAAQGDGKPMIAVGPMDPGRMIVVAMGQIQQLHGVPLLAPRCDYRAILMHRFKTGKGSAPALNGSAVL